MKRTYSMIITIVLILTTITGCLSPVDKEAISHVTNLINAIGDVNKDSGPKIEAAIQAFNSLDMKLQENIKNIEQLNNATATYNNIITANDVMRLITQIGSATRNSGSSIDSAYTLYNSLSNEQKALVTNSSVLEQAKDSYDQLKADEAITSIKLIGEITSASKPKIDSAFEKYALLTEEQKALVSNYDLLIQANDSYNRLKIDGPIADNVVKAIDSIGVVTLESKGKILSVQKLFDNLTPEQKLLVINIDKLQISKEEFSRLEIANVIELIDAIGKVDLNSLPVIEAAKKAYDALTPAQKELTTNFATLNKSFEEYSDAQINVVISKIDSIGYVSIEKKPKVLEARASYEELNSAQKAKVSNYALLESIEQTILGLEVAQVDRLIAGLNLNYLSQYDLDNSNKVKELYMKLPEETKKQVKDFDKYKQVSDIFANYFDAKNSAAYGDYEKAYNLMVNLNVMDSKQLAREYEKIAFRWWVEGGMTKEKYGRSEYFEVNIEVFGGKEGESIDISFTCSTPDWTNTGVAEDLYSGWGQGFYFWNARPEYASQGVGRMKIKNNTTGELLAEYEFFIQGD